MDTPNLDASFQGDYGSPAPDLLALPSGTNATVMALTTEFLWFANHLHLKLGRVLPDFKDPTAVSAFAAAAHQEGGDTEPIAIISAMLDTWSAMFHEIREGPKPITNAPVTHSAEASDIACAAPTIHRERKHSRSRSPSPPCPTASAITPGPLLDRDPSSASAPRSNSPGSDPVLGADSVHNTQCPTKKPRVTPASPIPTSAGSVAKLCEENCGKYNRDRSGTTGAATVVPLCAPNLQEQTFQGLTMNLMTHSWLPLILKKVFEVSTNQTVVVPECCAEFESRTGLATVLSIFAQSNGIQAALRRSTVVDVFMVALLTALDDLKHLPSDVHISPLLRKTLCACWNLANTVTAFRNADPPQRDRIAMPPHGVASSSPHYGRPNLSSADVRAILEKWFRDHYENPYPTHAEKVALSRKCDLSFNQVQTFFTNKRQSFKLKAKLLPVVYVPATGSSEEEPSVHLKQWRSEVLSKIPNINSVEFKRGVEHTHESIVDTLFPDQVESENIPDMLTVGSSFVVSPGKSFAGGSYLH